MMMMNAGDESSCNAEFPFVIGTGNPAQLPPTPALFLPVMDQGSSSFLRSEQLGSSDNMEANLPALLAPASNAAAAAEYTCRYGHDHDILQFYPSASHYLTAAGNPYNHLSQSNFLPSPQEYYFPTVLDVNLASFGATPPYPQLGLNSLNYGGYFPSRGGYAYGHHPPRCQVDGCTADLSKAKRYHRRHRVCEHHSKAPVVFTARAIMPQRFCQQCSRFHEVDEFDDTKKSCRQRLADHNRRRRKPKPSGTNVLLKKKAHGKRSATCKDKGNGSTSMGTGDVLGTQELIGSASKEHGQWMGLGEDAVTEPADPKGKAPVTKQQSHIPQANVEQGFPLHLSSGNSTCLLESHRVAGENTSNIAQVQETDLAFQQHYHQCNILQLGHAAFDLDFDH